ncbi:MAG: tRNA (cytidine(34)-2'-O)-methyltransferase [Neisseriaceae bacterium]|jgi:tRNA (cytidine/uridine-2'-O-)-methyltransferase
MIKNHALSVVLFQPEIPPNTGNIIRLCANTGCDLHLVGPIGFPLEDSKLKRAGLDYHEYTNLVLHNDWLSCKQYFNKRRIIAIETCGKYCYTDLKYEPYDVLLFGSETKGLPHFVLDDLQEKYIVRLPMQNNQRSLNLSNSVAVITYEAWRQLDFIGGVK